MKPTTFHTRSACAYRPRCWRVPTRGQIDDPRGPTPGPATLHAFRQPPGSGAIGAAGAVEAFAPRVHPLGPDFDAVGRLACRQTQEPQDRTVRCGAHDLSRAAKALDL